MNKNNQSPLAKRRIQCGFNRQDKLAEIIGVHSGTIHRIETGRMNLDQESQADTKNKYRGALQLSEEGLRFLVEKTQRWREEQDADERLINRSLKYT